jgi:PEP-CTERM motif
MTPLFSRAMPPLIAAATLFLAQSAMSSTTFLLDLRGQATHEVNAWECSPSPCSGGGPRLEPVTFDWLGALTLVTADDADGVYYGGLEYPDGELLSLSLESNLDDFDRPFTASAVVVGGHVVALDAYFENSPVKFVLADMTAFYDQPPMPHFGETRGTAIVTNVPEPSTWLLMVLGLAGVAVATRRRRDRHAVQITFLRAPAQVS